MSDQLSPSREKEFKRLQEENLRLKIKLEKLESKPGKEHRVQPDEFKDKLLAISDKLENALLRIFDLQKENEVLYKRNADLKQSLKQQRYILDIKGYIRTNNKLILRAVRNEFEKEKAK